MISSSLGDSVALEEAEVEDVDGEFALGDDDDGVCALEDDDDDLGDGVGALSLVLSLTAALGGDDGGNDGGDEGEEFGELLGDDAPETNPIKEMKRRAATIN